MVTGARRPHRLGGIPRSQSRLPRRGATLTAMSHEAEIHDAHVAASVGETPYTVSITTRSGHAILADEPVDAGGADAGANPYDLLLSALAACKLITVRMYADRKGWPLHGAHLRLTQRSEHAKDCQDCDSKDGSVHRIMGELSLVGDLTDEQRARLSEIADKCPVHRTLTSEIQIQTVLTEQ